MKGQSSDVVIAVVIAVICAFAPLPPEVIEREYSTRFYPMVQAILTTVTNQIPIALVDVAAGGLLIAGVMTMWSRLRSLGFRRAIGRTLVTLAGLTACLYLVFLVLWGLNYRRVPLEEKVDYDRGRLTPASALAFANLAVAIVNKEYAASRAVAPDLPSLETAFGGAQVALRATRLAVAGVPKHSLLTFYFRRAAIDGMTDPFFLEIIVNTDVLAFERPFVVAHEWAHLAGYANEEEANFIAWLTCVRGDALARYSGWLAAYQHLMNALPQADRRRVKPLDAGPLRDLQAMSARYQRSSPVVREAARGVYDEYLRANRVAEGIGSYDAVVRLLVGTRFDDQWSPRLR